MSGALQGIVTVMGLWNVRLGCAQEIEREAEG
jgi:hypothetical protein